MVKEGKSLTVPVPTPWDETLEPSASVTEGKELVEDKEENKDLLPIIWSVAPESKIQGPGAAMRKTLSSRYHVENKENRDRD